MKFLKLFAMVAGIGLVLEAAILIPVADTIFREVRRLPAKLSKLLVGGQTEAELPKGARFHRKGAGKPGANGWYDAKSTEGHFRISLPIPFNDATIVPEDKDEGIAYTIGSTSAEGFKFVATEFIPAKRRNAEEVTKKLARGFREDHAWKVSKEKYFTHDNYPAVEIKVGGPETGAWSRVVALPDRSYLLTVEYPVGSDGELEPVAEYFFDSLRIEAKIDAKRK